MNKQMKNTLTKVLIFFVLLVGAYCLWCHFLTDNVIWTKLKVNGIAIQGMTEEEAIDRHYRGLPEKLSGQTDDGHPERTGV